MNRIKLHEMRRSAKSPKSFAEREETVHPGKQLKIAWSFAVLPNYRLPFLRRLAQVPDLELTYFHGQGKEGFTARSVGPELPVRSVWVKNYFWPFGGRALWRSGVWSIFREKYDVVVLTEVVHDLSTWVLWVLLKMNRTPIILSGYGYRPQHLSGILQRLRDRLRKILLKSADAIIVYTERGYNTCVQEGIEAEKIFVSKNTMDTEYLMGITDDIKQDELNVLRRHYNCVNSPVILYVGKFLPVKRIDILIDAFKKLSNTALSPVLLMVGEGSELQSLSKRINGEKNIHFLGPIYDERKLAKIFLVSDLLVIPGRVGLTCVHGFCYGVPVVTTAHGVEQSPEFDYVRHKENGYLVQAPNADLYADAISSLLHNRSEMNLMREQAQQTAWSLTMTNMVSQFTAAVKYATK